MRHLLLCLVASCVAEVTLVAATGSVNLAIAVMVPVSFWLGMLANDADCERREVFL